MPDLWNQAEQELKDRKKGRTKKRESVGEWALRNTQRAMRSEALGKLKRAQAKFKDPDTAQLNFNGAQVPDKKRLKGGIWDNE